MGDVHQVMCVLAKLVVYDEEDEGQSEAEAAHGDVRNAQERVAASEPWGVGQDNAFAALERRHRITWHPAAAKESTRMLYYYNSAPTQ